MATQPVGIELLRALTWWLVKAVKYSSGNIQCRLLNRKAIRRQAGMIDSQGIQAFLEKEGFDFKSSSSRLDDQLLNASDPTQQNRTRKAWQTRNEKLRLTRMYELPRTLHQANLLFSHDRSRILKSYEHLLKTIDPDVKMIADVGCGSGSLVRLIAQLFPGAHVVGIDIAANLIDVAKAVSHAPNVRFEKLDLSRLSMLGHFDLIVSACGIEEPFLPEPSFEDLMMTKGEGIMPGYRRVVAQAFGERLSGLRHAAHDQTKLRGVFRFPTETLTKTFIDVAQDSGWTNAEVTKLSAGTEQFPAICFQAGT